MKLWLAATGPVKIPSESKSSRDRKIRKRPGQPLSVWSQPSSPTASTRLQCLTCTSRSFKIPASQRAIYLRTLGDPGTLGDLIRHEVQSVDPGIPVFAVRTMDEVVARSLADRRFALTILGVFAGVALLLASIGIYGVMAYTFSQRTHEIGVRVALGAQRSDILRLALGEGMILVAVGLGAGLIGAAIVTRFLRSMLFSVTATDPITFVSIAALLAAVALLACFIPARRATQVDPLVALRED